MHLQLDAQLCQRVNGGIDGAIANAFETMGLALIAQVKGDPLLLALFKQMVPFIADRCLLIEEVLAKELPDGLWADLAAMGVGVALYRRGESHLQATR